MDVAVVVGREIVYTLTLTRLLQNCRLGLLRKEKIACSFFLFDGPPSAALVIA